MEDRSNEVEEQRFLRLFSKQLAEALRAKDEEEAEERERLRGPPGRSSGNEDETKQWERLRSAYVELCHDEPIVLGGDAVCRRLAKALIPRGKSKKAPGKDKDTNKLALSSRLVNGILQATSRAGAKATGSSSSAPSDTTQANEQDAANPEQESMFGPSNITTSGGYAEIAFAMFVEGPYRCIQQAENLPVASKFLGSFQPPDTSDVPSQKLAAEEKSRLADEATAKIVSGMEKMAMESEKKQTNKTSATNIRDDSSSSSSEFFRPNTTHGTQQRFDDDNNSMEEIFAEESDPDDYEYESSYNPYSSTSNGQTIIGQKSNDTGYDDIGDFGFNPLQLSEPNTTNQTWEGARQAIHYLLSNLSYGKLALGSISSRAWSDGGMSDTLADLCFILLLENTKRDRDNAAVEPKSLLHQMDREGENVDDIAALWDQPLFLLRDRALDKNRDHDALPAYAQLMTAFLCHSEKDVMSILSSPLGTSTPEDILPPITAVGLSSLATICSSKDMISASAGRMCGTSVWSVCPREEVKDAILSSLYPLARIVECVRPRKSIFTKSGSIDQGAEKEAESSPWIRTVVCIIPMMEYLTNLQARFDFQPLFEGGGSRSGTLSDPHAEAISESGLFREMLSLYTNTSNVNDSSAPTKPDAEVVVRMQLLRTIFMLATLSPELLGKYAVRVPDFIKEVHSSSFMEKYPVDGILWTSTGSSLLENKTDAVKPRLKLRTNSKLSRKGPIETKSLAERSISGFEAMCYSSKKALQRMSQIVRSAENHVTSDEEKAAYDGCKYSLGDIRRFSNCLSNCPPATKLWLDSLKNKEGSAQKATENIAEIKSALTALPSFSDEIKTPQGGHKKDDDDCVESVEDDSTDAGHKIQTLKQLQKDYGTTVASIRSSVKVIALALESHKGAGLSLKGTVPYSVSSKTD